MMLTLQKKEARDLQRLGNLHKVTQRGSTEQAGWTPKAMPSAFLGFC